MLVRVKITIETERDETEIPTASNSEANTVHSKLAQTTREIISLLRLPEGTKSVIDVQL